MPRPFGFPGCRCRRRGPGVRWGHHRDTLCPRVDLWRDLWSCKQSILILRLQLFILFSTTYRYVRFRRSSAFCVIPEWQPFVDG